MRALKATVFESHVRTESRCRSCEGRRRLTRGTPRRIIVRRTECSGVANRAMVRPENNTAHPHVTAPHVDHSACCDAQGRGNLCIRTMHDRRCVLLQCNDVRVSAVAIGVSKRG